MAVYSRVLASVSGRRGVTTSGEELIFTGNRRFQAGDSVWTDGKYIYGLQARRGGYLPMNNDTLLPILCNNGSELLVFDKNFSLIGKYSCSKTDIIALSNIADYFAIGDTNGNIFTSDGKKYNIRKLVYYKNYYIANSIAITNDSIYALISENRKLYDVYGNFSLTKNGKLVYTSWDLLDSLKSKMSLPESKVLEHYGYYYIPGGCSKEINARLDAIMNDPVSAGAFHDEESEKEIFNFLERSAFQSGEICLKNGNDDIIGYYNFDTKTFDLGVKLGPGEDNDSPVDCYYSNYDEQMAAELSGAGKALAKLKNDDYHYEPERNVAFFYKCGYHHHKEQYYMADMVAKYLYKNGNVLITATGHGECTTTDSHITGDDIMNLKYDTKSTTDNEIDNEYQGIIYENGNISITQTESKVYKLDDTVLVSAGTGFCNNKQTTSSGAGYNDWTNFSAIQMGENVFGFYGGESGQNIYVNGKVIEELSSHEYVNNRLNWMDRETLKSLCDFLGAE